MSPVSSPAGPWIQMVDAVTAMGLVSFFSGELLFEVEHELDSLKIGRFTKWANLARLTFWFLTFFYFSLTTNCGVCAKFHPFAEVHFGLVPHAIWLHFLMRCYALFTAQKQKWFVQALRQSGSGTPHTNKPENHYLSEMEVSESQGSPSHHGFQYSVMVIHDDWMIQGGSPTLANHLATLEVSSGPGKQTCGEVPKDLNDQGPPAAPQWADRVFLAEQPPHFFGRSTYCCVR